MKADLVLRKGRIRTMDRRQPIAEAAASIGDRWVAVGGVRDVDPLIGPGTIVMDLCGQAVVPGLTDSHVHLAGYGLSLQQVDGTGVQSAEAVAARVRDRASGLAPGAWIRGRGWDRNLWSPQEAPLRQVLDEATSVHPVALGSKDGHALWLNTEAFRRLGIGAEQLSAWGHEQAPLQSDGSAWGVLYERAAGDVEGMLARPSFDDVCGALQTGARVALAFGITGVHNCEGAVEFAATLHLRRQGALPIRLHAMIAHGDLDAAMHLGVATGLGDEWVRLGHLKLFADGSLGSRTADMLECYLDDARNRGIEVLSSDDLAQAVAAAAGAGIAPAIHAIGDRANRRALDVLERTRARWHGRGLRPRIEHVQLLAEDDIPRLANLGVIASMQPIHATSDWEMAEACWGARTIGAYAWRSLLNSGTILAFGSDCPVETMDPFSGIYAAVTRQRCDGTPVGGWRTEQCLSVTEAVWSYTQGAAWASGEESTKGSITPGKVADAAILSQDIFTVPADALPATRVEATVCGGKVAYRASR